MRRWYAGRWRTEEGIENHRRSSREGHRRYDGSPADLKRRLARTIEEKEARLGTQQAD